MKRVLPFLFFFLIASVVTGVLMTGRRASVVRAELARRGWKGPEVVQPATEPA